MKVYLNPYSDFYKINVQMSEHSTVYGLSEEEAREFYTRLGTCLDILDANPNIGKDMREEFGTEGSSKEGGV